METNIIYNEDCFERLKKIDDNSIDLVVSDPPYEFISKSPKGGGFMKKNNKKHLISIEKSFGLSFSPIVFLNEMKRILKYMNLYVFTNKNLLFDYLNFIKQNNYYFDILLWLKNNPVPIN